MITHRCGTTIPADVETYVRHLASCPDTWGVAAGICQGIVNAVEHEAAQNETPTETRVVSAVPDIEELAILRDGGMSYRGLANVAGVAPETVRRRINKWKQGNGL